MRGKPFKEFMAEKRLVSRTVHFATFMYGILAGCMLMYAFMLAGLAP